MYNENFKNIDSKEIELPDTLFIRDIESRVFQGIVLHTLAKIEGISLIEGNFLDSLLGRNLERVKGLHVGQNGEKQTVDIRVEIHVHYGICIPEKAEEIQNKIVEEISRWTGLHVSSVHVIFKELIIPQEEPSLSSDETTEEAVVRF